jgi:hypothetical protein
MAIKSFKEIIKNKAYLISPEDRKIFEDGSLQSFFGLGEKDVIEFIIYDSSDNQLTQANGELVRYIPMTSQNIGNYVLIPEGTLLRKYQFPAEYFIDVETLIREAGYTTGIFKTQVTLLNNRVGSNDQYDKLWISEVSPSRTEIRVEPLKKGMELNPQLYERFQLFINNGDFRDDTIYYIPQFLAKIQPNDIDTMLRNQYGSVFFDRLLVEYSITNFDGLMNDIYNTFIDSAVNEFSNRYSDINDPRYGKPKDTQTNIKLSRIEISEKCKELLVNSINLHLKKPTYSTSTTYDNELLASRDAVDVKKILIGNK